MINWKVQIILNIFGKLNEYSIVYLDYGPTMDSVHKIWPKSCTHDSCGFWVIVLRPLSQKQNRLHIRWNANIIHMIYCTMYSMTFAHFSIIICHEFCSRNSSSSLSFCSSVFSMNNFCIRQCNTVWTISLRLSDIIWLYLFSLASPVICLFFAQSMDYSNTDTI